jgi:hypothetical protein
MQADGGSQQDDRKKPWTASNLFSLRGRDSPNLAVWGGKMEQHNDDSIKSVGLFQYNNQSYLSKS